MESFLNHFKNIKNKKMKKSKRVLAKAMFSIAFATQVAISNAQSGPSEGPTSEQTIQPFHVKIPQKKLVDLKRRILETRWPDQELVSDQSQGVQLATMQKLAQYWAKDYDWRKL